jgi:hypothetical protein
LVLCIKLHEVCFIVVSNLDLKLYLVRYMFVNKEMSKMVKKRTWLLSNFKLQRKLH